MENFSLYVIKSDFLLMSGGDTCGTYFDHAVNVEHERLLTEIGDQVYRWLLLHPHRGIYFQIS
jgi:hypothetical protein